ncbi:MAG: FixH family protein [Pyrinomonadaceae bacterium]
MKKVFTLAILSTLSVFIILSAACSSGSKPTADNPIAGKVIKSGAIGSLTATLTNDSGKLKSGDQEVTLAFSDASGKAVDVGSASLNFFMPAMGSMAAMNDAAPLTTTGTPGVYKSKVKLSMAGDWQAQIAIEGPAGNSKASLPVIAQ